MSSRDCKTFLEGLVRQFVSAAAEHSQEHRFILASPEADD
jgi:hypothetical protein